MRTVYQFDQNTDQDTMDDIRESVDNILKIPSGTIPLSRGLGVSWRSLSEVQPDLENDYAVELVEKIEKYEPRVAVDEITFENDPLSGEVVVRIVFEGSENDE